MHGRDNALSIQIRVAYTSYIVLYFLNLSIVETILDAREVKTAAIHHLSAL